MNSEIDKNSYDLSINWDYIFYPPYEKFWIDKFNLELTSMDAGVAYQKLILNLDRESSQLVSTILDKINSLKKEGLNAIDIFTQKEIIEVKKTHLDFMRNILQKNNDMFQYEKYLLPVNHFQICVFYDKHYVESLKTLDKIKNKDIIDAGGFIGDSALVLSDYTDKNVYSFEPLKKNYDNILKTISINNLNNVKAHNFGLGSKNETTEIYINNSASSISFDPFNQNIKEDVSIKTLDEVVQSNNLDVGLIKVDVEGYEQDFLKGAEQTIKSQKPALLLSIYHSASDFFNIKTMLESWNLGYKFKIMKSQDGHILLETTLIAECY